MKRMEDIYEKIAKKFGFPTRPPVHPDWLKAELRRTGLSKNIKKPADVAPLIDHTMLKPEASVREIIKLCDEAANFGFASVCVNPYWVSTASIRLLDLPVMVCSVVGFPLGANTTEIKTIEAKRVVDDGASEIDMVINIGALKSGSWEAVHADISSVVEVSSPAPVKVILETALLSEEEIIYASLISRSAGAAFVKTSTGFSKGGATTEAVSLMTTAVGKYIGIKASGGIGDFESALAMVKAGATRIGSSKSIMIIGK